IFQNDIFVNIETLKKWFVLDLYFNSQDQEIVVNSGGLLPIEKRFERQKEWQRLSGGKKDKENLEQTKEAEDVIKNNYKIASVPFGDINYAHGYSKSNSKSNSTSNLN